MITIDKTTINDNFLDQKEASTIKVIDVTFDSIKIEINSFLKCYKLRLSNVRLIGGQTNRSFKKITYLSVRNQIADIRLINELFPNLEFLEIYDCKIIDDPKTTFKDIRYFEIRNSGISEIPKFIFNSPNLNDLIIGDNSLEIEIPTDLILIKTLRRLTLFDLVVSKFNYSFNKITLIDRNDIYLLILEDCIFHNFLKDLNSKDENCIIISNNCEFKNYTPEELTKLNLIMSAD